MRNWIAVDLLGNPLFEEVENRRHFHQLFRQLRVATQTSRRNFVRQDLRHSDDLLGNRRECGEELHEVRQLFHHLRHRVVEKRHQRNSVDDLLHGAPQNPLLRSGQGNDPVRPGAPELRHTVIVVEREVLCAGLLGEECFRNLAVYCVSYSSPGPVLPLSLCCC